MLADKIIELRKKNGWSQEQLGEQLGVSRQSVSKWETGLAVPELDNIMQMSELFGVSTDYLLKDSEEAISSVAYSSGEKESCRRVNAEEALTYMDLAKKVAGRIAVGVSLCIFSPIPLLLLGGYAECFGGISENAAGGFGVAMLFVIVALGVLILVWNGQKLSPYEYLEKEPILIGAETKNLAEERKSAEETRFRLANTAGVVLCILGVVPLFVAAALDSVDFVYVCMVAVLLFMVALAVQCFIRVGIPMGAYQKLLQEGEYTKEGKAVYKKISFVPGVYWCTVTALFLLFGFLTENWGMAGYIWPVAGVLFVAFWGIVSAVAKSKDKKE
ncbi:MAG: helix-turn-helix transcriptional regulator [Firmicutes bacterium]|nr:helix-turn-helix transcriptional regulator [Bacillota bacterium]